MTEAQRVPLPGSARTELTGAELLGPADPEATISATLVLRRRAELDEAALTGPEFLTPAALAERYGAADEDVRRVRETLTAAGLTVIEEHPGSRRVVVTGPVRALNDVFGTELSRVRVRDGGAEHHARTGELSLPAVLDGVVTAVLGLDERDQARAQFRVYSGTEAAQSVTPDQLGSLYDFPPHTDGAGQTVAIIELGGGFTTSDIDDYLSGLNLPVPQVSAVEVDGVKNAPTGDPNSADGEVLLDIEVIGALAPGVTQLVYFAPNTDQGFLDAVSTAIHATPTPAAVSISWGQSEDQWTEQARTAMDQAFADAAALGVTICAASGDSGSTDGETDGKQHADFPASSPHALACGGTHLDATPPSTITAETVWNAGGGASGGGVSDAFPVPDFQTSAGVPARADGGTGRGVPDVAGNADPATGYQILVDGQQAVVGGTSAVAPLWSALICRLAQGAGRRFGLIHTQLYQGAQPGRPQPGFRDITDGDNGAYQAAAGWDACTGLGSPDGAALLRALTAG
ncbi:S53 family peptidase [Amycolatopsis acidiphila]|uniref:S8/S53 family peptidase n=1 Tax=Amycolatopsis acidiphila TaxID=715473 RepID=A0A558A507_9PSEU|nr:S53 family peptidase [Amycolatopsis acidiphila]TVT19347.1 S8/S53 family peptidase [Amycolatopsis acidiphila]UIJ61713.1 S53 family peptidase [Amycolatopsis acidiphila]GHG58267.1 kumamolisin [Amycolatopsis acidiphila]